MYPKETDSMHAHLCDTLNKSLPSAHVKDRNQQIIVPKNYQIAGQTNKNVHCRPRRIRRALKNQHKNAILLLLF